uniref:Uncharacterized protein n=1 Tax=Megaselia scalaris TaxID=36166 RepID=T1GC82_MEGSC
MKLHNSKSEKQQDCWFEWHPGTFQDSRHEFQQCFPPTAPPNMEPKFRSRHFPSTINKPNTRRESHKIPRDHNTKFLDILRVQSAISLYSCYSFEEEYAALGILRQFEPFTRRNLGS